MNFTDSAYTMSGEEMLLAAERQFAMAEAVDSFAVWLYERGGWFLLLRWAEVSRGVGDKHGG